MEPSELASEDAKMPSRSGWAVRIFSATARDFARFGYLYLRDGWWDDRRILPSDWVTRARTITPESDTDDTHNYGEHWWLWRDAMGAFGAFSAHGFEGQYIIIVPKLDLVLVRLGKSPEEFAPALHDWIRAVVHVFA